MYVPSAGTARRDAADPIVVKIVFKVTIRFGCRTTTITARLPLVTVILIPTTHLGAHHARAIEVTVQIRVSSPRAWVCPFSPPRGAVVIFLKPVVQTHFGAAFGTVKGVHCDQLSSAPLHRTPVVADTVVGT